MEHSKPNVETSDLSLNASDSQFLDHSYSLAFPSGLSFFSPNGYCFPTNQIKTIEFLSNFIIFYLLFWVLPEPPELRIWFSSYEYESPALGSINNFGEPVLEESEIEKDKSVKNEGAREEEENLDGFREIGKREKVLVGEKLNSNRFIECSSSFDDDEGENQSSDKDKDCSYSPLPLSEPTDIRNWFSSYVYESPALDTNDGLMDSVYLQSKSKKDELVVEESNKDKSEKFWEFKGSGISDEKVVGESGLQSCDDFRGYSKQKKLPSMKAGSRFGVETENLFDQSGIHIESMFKQSSKHKVPQNQGTDSANNITIPSLGEEGSNSMPNPFHEIGSMPLNIQNSCSKASKELSNRIKSIQENSQLNCQTKAASCLSRGSGSKSVLDNGASVRKFTHGCNGKENTGKEISKDGFVSTRKGRYSSSNDENCLKVSKENGDGTTMPLAGDKHPHVKRKALSERTNLQPSSGVETIGKWKCPQRNKPILGPPLKQLRLERWVHRV
ncbi:uncharacterized protein LOC107412926 isoform X1 [Ziziphus jujuba]|uniref:Uncharacterized protein LOC107412926 isoform X1 n=1 Tax=Ziziphus jujuba TaxID=326968 RepID=A0ABM3IDJ2_ZIZJJ|nr:uncharacterized protein LOC107412926 isoform X1 [Ziziphus jujuba]XP_060675616.1 uncharacterized protein LOC107412926 isoform X1 [Ziziphus jujuba]